MKKLLIAATAAALVLVLVGCTCTPKRGDVTLPPPTLSVTTEAPEWPSAEPPVAPEYRRAEPAPAPARPTCSATDPKDCGLPPDLDWSEPYDPEIPAETTVEVYEEPRSGPDGFVVLVLILGAMGILVALCVILGLP